MSEYIRNKLDEWTGWLEEHKVRFYWSAAMIGLTAGWIVGKYS